jgi:shikimate dehydrogenase
VETALAGAASITVVNRNRQRGGQLVELLDERTPVMATFVPSTEPYRLPESADVVVNATSVGLFPDVDGYLNLDFDSLRPHMVVADVIPNPPRTRLIRDAEQRGCTTLDGLGMLVNQGVIGIRHWTGIDPDPAVMRRALEAALSQP